MVVVIAIIVIIIIFIIVIVIMIVADFIVASSSTSSTRRHRHRRRRHHRMSCDDTVVLCNGGITKTPHQSGAVEAIEVSNATPRFVRASGPEMGRVSSRRCALYMRRYALEANAIEGPREAGEGGRKTVPQVRKWRRPTRSLLAPLRVRHLLCASYGGRAPRLPLLCEVKERRPKFWPDSASQVSDLGGHRQTVPPRPLHLAPSHRTTKKRPTPARFRSGPFGHVFLPPCARLKRPARTHPTNIRVSSMPVCLHHLRAPHHLIAGGTRLTMLCSSKSTRHACAPLGLCAPANNAWS